MKKVLNLFSWFFKNKIGRIIIIILIIFIISFSVFIYLDNKKNKIDTSYIIAKLEESSELTTTKLNYTGMSEFEDTGVSFINRSDFIMVYEATARIGIDVKEISIKSDSFNKVIWIKMPKAKVLDVKVDLNKIKYFDEKFALFNVDYKQDVNKATALAEQSAKEELEKMGILDMANTQSITLIRNLINDLIPKNYEVKVR